MTGPQPLPRLNFGHNSLAELEALTVKIPVMRASQSRKLTPPPLAESVVVGGFYKEKPPNLPADTAFCLRCRRLMEISNFRMRKDGGGPISACKKHDCIHLMARSNCRMCWLQRQIKQVSGLEAAAAKNVKEEPDDADVGEIVRQL